MKALKILFLLSLAVILGCEKEKSCENQECKDCLVDNFYVGKIKDCGFILMKKDNSARIYKPIKELPENYKTEFLGVKLTYKEVSQGEKCSYDGITKHIEIIKIEKISK